MNQRITRELQHIATGPLPDEKPFALGTVRFVAWCSGNAESVLTNAKEVLRIVAGATGISPDDPKWKELLPEWFIKRCSAEMTREQAELELAKLSSMSAVEQVEEEESAAWPLSNWLHYFEPDNRNWYWWDGIILDQDIVVIAVEVDHWPFPAGSLKWLLRASGATKVEPEP